MMTEEKLVKIGEGPPLPVRKMPKAPKTWKEILAWLGPGIISGTIASGGGELMTWPYTTLLVGGGFLWMVGVATYFNLWSSQEAARYVLYTGEGYYQAFARLKPKYFWGFFFLALTILWGMWPAWVASAAACWAKLVEVGTPLQWGYIWMFIMLITMAAAKYVYPFIEKFFLIVGLANSLGALVCISLMATPEAIGEVLRGIVSFGYIPPGVTLTMVYWAAVASGNGGMINIFWANYVKEKGMGMGQYMPRSLGLYAVVRGEAENVPERGYVFDTKNPEELSDYWRFFHILQLDQGIFSWFLGTCLIVWLFSIGVLSVSWPKVPTAAELPYILATTFGKKFGIIAEKFFLFTVFCAFIDSQWAIYDSISRVTAEQIYISIPRARKHRYSALYWTVFLIYFVLGLFALPVAIPFHLWIIATSVGMLSQPIYVPFIMYINNKFLPKELRPGIISWLTAIAAFIFWTVASYGALQAVGLVPK
jgi:hypothetical protein